MVRNLEREGQEGGMRGLSNCWQASTWHMNLKAIPLCLAQSRVWSVTHGTHVKRKGNREGGGAFAAAPFILLGARPPNIAMTLAHSLTKHTHTYNSMHSVGRPLGQKSKVIVML